MGLAFTNIPDRDGAAVYLLHDGTITQQRQMEHIAADIAQKASCQTVVLSARNRDGEMVRDFYDLDVQNFPHILVVRDDDQLGQLWSGTPLPPVDQIVHVVGGISA